MEIENTLNKIIEVTKAKPSGSGFIGHCPAHDDRNPSFSFKFENSKPLLKCFSGCSFESCKEGLQRLGVNLDMSEESDPGKVVAQHFYQDEFGNDILQIKRKKFNNKPKKTLPYVKVNGDWVIGKDGSSSGLKVKPYKYFEWFDLESTLYIAEGEKAADRLWSHGLAATTFRGGSNGWDDSYAKDFYDRQIVILPDNDVPGAKFARLVYEGLESVAKSVKIVKAFTEEEASDVVDWLASGKTIDDLKQLCEANNDTEDYLKTDPVTAAVNEWKDPELPFTILPIGTKFPFDVLPTILSSACNEVSKFNKVSPVMPALIGLGTTSAVIGKKARIIERDGLMLLPNTWVNGLARSGERKSDTFKLMQKPLLDYREKMLPKYREELDRVNSHNQVIDMEIASLKSAISKDKDSSRNSRISRISSLSDLQKERLKYPVEPQIVGDDTTEEALIQILAERDGVFSVSSGEARNIFNNMMGRYSNGHTGEAVYLKALSGDPIFNNRKGDRKTGRDAFAILEPCVSLTTLVQHDKYEELISDEAMRKSGLIARMLTCEIPSMVGYRQELQNEPGLNNAALLAYYEVIKAILDSKYETYHQANLSDEATLIRRAFFNSIESELLDGQYSDVSDVASKITSNSCRLAYYLHVWDDPSILTIPMSSMTGETMERATILARYFLDESSRLIRIGKTKCQFEDHKKLIRFLARKALASFRVPEIVQYTPYGNLRNTKFLKKICKDLTSWGLLKEDGSKLIVHPNIKRISGQVNDEDSDSAISAIHANGFDEEAANG